MHSWVLNHLLWSIGQVNLQEQLKCFSILVSIFNLGIKNGENGSVNAEKNGKKKTKNLKISAEKKVFTLV